MLNPSKTRFGALAECSFDIAIVSKPANTAQANAIALKIPVIGT